MEILEVRIYADGQRGGFTAEIHYMDKIVGEAIEIVNNRHYESLLRLLLENAAKNS